MARIELAAAIGDDFERILEHLFRYDVRNTVSRLEELIESIDILKRSPMIGRPLPGGLRELTIGGSRSYVALCRTNDGTGDRPPGSGRSRAPARSSSISSQARTNTDRRALLF